AVIEKLESQLGDTHLRLVYTEKEGTPKEEPRSELESSPTDGDSPETYHIHLPPISSGGCETMFEAGLRQKGKLVRDLSTIAYERCGGNPRLLIEIVKTLRQEFQSLKGIDSFKLLRLQTLITESQAEGYVRRRWDKLSSTARKVIAVAAVVGRKFTPDLVDKLADRPKNEVRKAIAEGLNQQIIASWNMLGEDWYCFAHDLVHDDVYASLPESTRLQLHRRLAETLEEESGNDGSNTYEIALHYLRGDDPAKAHRYTLQAARTAKAAYANREAIYFFSEALKLLPGQNDELKLSILEDLGDACVLDGRYDSAKDHYQRVLALVSNRMHRARLEGKIGDMYFRRGMNESAIEHLKTGLAHLGVSLPRTTIGLYGSIAFNVIRQIFHRCIPCSWLLLSNERRREICRLAINSCHSLAYAYYFLDAPRTLCVHLRQLNLSERLGDSPELAHTYSSHGIVCSLIPLHARAYRYQCAGLDVRKRLQDRWGIGQSNAFLGVCCYYRAELSRAIEFLRQSVRILESTGDQWEIEAAYSHLGFCFLLQGEVDAADEVNKSLLKLATEIQDLKFIAVAQTSLAEADLIRGNIDRALHLIDKALAVASENFNRAIAMRVRGQILLKLNRHDEARQCLNEALAIIRQGKLKNEYLVPNHIAIAEAELADVDRILAMGTEQKRRYLRRVEKHVRTGIAMASKFRNHLGYALRVRAVYHRLSGSVERAETDFIESEKILTEQGRLYELARTTLEWAHWKSRDGTLTELENVRGAREVFRKVGARLDLYDAHDLLGLRNGEVQEKQQPSNQNHQLSSLAKMSRSISSILDVDRLTLQFTDLAIEVTGGERGYLFLEGINNKAEVFCARGSDRQDLPHDLPSESTPVINRAWHSGLAQVASLPNAKLTDETESTSVICVPLRAGEKTFGLIYIENALGPDAYTEQDIEFLTIFSSQAAVSLQNAYSYQTVEELNSNLDRKVRARTQELLEKKQEIENTNRLKSEFLANMSHELRTPLNAVIAMSEILVEQTFGELNDKQKTYLSHIIDSGVHLLDLINDVLDLSKIEAGQFDLQFDYFNLDDLLRRSLVVIKEKAAKKSVDLK
ncbi:MAG: tetratricopeptide repeat protein, partial [Planctomycetes bacterium]|nr:tetratricopeptide repeat protein [Planctomycetota bacterium]